MSGAIDLKSLAAQALERLHRNKARNGIGTNDENFVPQAEEDGTRNDEDELTALDLLVEFEERIAICHYDGGLAFQEALAVAASDYCKLNAFVYD